MMRLFRKKDKWLLLLGVLMAAVLIQTIALMYISDVKRDNKKNEAYIYGERMASTIQLTLDNTLSDAEALEYFYLGYGEIGYSRFDTLAAAIMRDNPVISSVYFAPKGVIQQAYPENVKASTIGFAMLKDPEQGPRAQLAVDTRKITVAGPHNLIENGTGLIIRNPIFQGDEFKAFSIIVLDWDKFVQRVQKNTGSAEQYRYAVWKADVDETAVTDSDGFILRSDAGEISRDVDVEFQVPNDTWHLVVEPVGGWAVWPDMMMPIAISLIIVVAIVILFWLYLVAQERNSQLKQLRLREKQRQRDLTMLTDLNMMMAAVDTVYPQVSQVNLTRNTHKVMSMDFFLRRQFQELENFDEVIQQAAGLVPEGSQRDGYLEHFDREHQLEAYYQGKQDIKYVHQQLGEDGKYHWMHTQTIFVNGTSKDVMQVSFSRCIDDEIERQEKLNQAKKEAERASKAKTAFLFNMSHDIRTPMNAIIGYTNLLEKNLAHTDAGVCMDYLDKIKYSSEFLLSLINNVLEMSRIESGKVTLDLAPCSTSSVSYEIEHIYAELMQKKQIKFSIETDIKTPYVYGDKLKLNEIFLNLISNAYKYTPAGGSVHASMQELPCDRPGWIFLQTKISDTGIGISADYLPKIFEEFTRERNSTDAKIQGTGLGMPIVKRLVKLMDGTITVESEQGKGTTFVVTLPHKIAAPPQEYAVPKVEVQLEKLAGKRILLAEDNEINAEIATMILSDVGIKVDAASDGVECLDMLQRAESGYYDLILMDIQMPNMDGYQAARSIRNLTDSAKRSIPIIAMTANAFEEDRKNAMAVGMNEHLPKPIDVNKLLELLTQYLH